MMQLTVSKIRLLENFQFEREKRKNHENILKGMQRLKICYSLKKINSLRTPYNLMRNTCNKNILLFIVRTTILAIKFNPNYIQINVRF